MMTTEAAASAAAQRADATGVPAAVVDGQGRVVNVQPAGTVTRSDLDLGADLDVAGGLFVPAVGAGAARGARRISTRSAVDIGAVAAAVIMCTGLAVSLVYYACFVVGLPRGRPEI
jgi:hypothetical protein